MFTEEYLPSWVKYKGTNYRPGMTLLVSQSSNGDPQFGTIKTIMVINSTTKVIVKNWETTGFDRHYFAFTVSPLPSIQAIDLDSIVDHHPLHVMRSYKENDDNHYISTRYRLF